MPGRTPEQVFTPKAIVTREMFERRNEPDTDGNPGLQDTLQDALRERGGQVLLYGDTGVGKSSLLKYAAEDEGRGMVTVPCTTGMTQEAILEHALRQLVDVRQLTRTEGASIGAEISAEGRIPYIAKLVGRLRGDVSESAEFEIVEKPLLDVLIDAMNRSDVSLLVLENFQNIADDTTRTLIAQTMEQLSDRADVTDDPDIKCVVIGIAEDAATLLGKSRSYGRRTTEIGVPRMPDDEIAAILVKGFRTLLEIDISDELLRRFVFYSDGFPYFAHLLGLNVARAARRVGAREVQQSMLGAALQRSASAVTASFGQRVVAASEVGGDVQPRKQIMRLLAKTRGREWSGTDIQAIWSAEFIPTGDLTFIHTALAQLSSDEYGKILRRSGSARRYRYRFEDPHIRPFLRIKFDLT